MGSHPLNLAIRFILELIALAVLGWWGWTLGAGALRYLLAVAVPVGAAALWGTFRVPEDPSSSGRAPVAVPGWLRLTIELSIFLAATWMLADLDKVGAAAIFGGAVVLHYAASWDRLAWLLRS